MEQPQQQPPKNHRTDLFTTGTTSSGHDTQCTRTCFDVRMLSLHPFDKDFDMAFASNPRQIAKCILENVSLQNAKTSFVHFNVKMHIGYIEYLDAICREINSLASGMNFGDLYYISTTYYDFSVTPKYDDIRFEGFVGFKLAFGVSSKRPVQPKCKLTSTDTDFLNYYMG